MGWALRATLVVVFSFFAIPLSCFRHCHGLHWRRSVVFIICHARCCLPYRRRPIHVVMGFLRRRCCRSLHWHRLPLLVLRWCRPSLLWAFLCRCCDHESSYDAHGRCGQWHGCRCGSTGSGGRCVSSSIVSGGLREG
jgi:hypothetical protein